MSVSPPTPPSLASQLAAARAALSHHFGYPEFREPQRPAVEAVLAGGDVLIVLPTGGGKSLCYQVPALVRPGLTLVVSPLISLMQDQVETLGRHGIAAAFLNSTLDARDAAERLTRARNGQLTLLYLAPERLVSPRLLETLAGMRIGLLAIDEAHCISEWGHEFRPAYRRIGALRVRLGHPQTVALTATATPAVQRDICTQLGLRNARVIVGGFDRTNLTYHVIPTPTARARVEQTVRWLRRVDGAAIVYAPTRTAVERIATGLVRACFPAAAYHGGLPAHLRQNAQDAFMDDRVRVMVATSAFGMGIDKPDVRLVLHDAMPASIEAYYQEAGRAGRDRQPGTCVLLHAPSDRNTHADRLARVFPSRAVVERVWRQLRSGATAAGLVLPASVPGAPRLGDSSGGPLASALRLLIAAGLCAPEPANPGRVWVRLLATPDRIRRELEGPLMADRAVLRELWRRAGDALTDGVVVDTRAWPIVHHASGGLVPALERLASRQFVMWTRTGGGLRLQGDWYRHHRPPVDWTALDQRRLAESARLDAMQGYASTRDCRRAYLLRYFGDADARRSCGACDRCLNALPPDA